MRQLAVLMIGGFLVGATAAVLTERAAARAMLPPAATHTFEAGENEAAVDALLDRHFHEVACATDGSSSRLDPLCK